MARIVVLHGASSSGKTTWAHALQDRADGLFLHLSSDHPRDGGALPHARLQRGDFDWARVRPAIFAGFHAALSGFAAPGNDLILEHILDTEGWLDDLRRGFAGHDVLFVGMFCEIAELKRRERIRGNRPVGSAEADTGKVHAGLRYDLTVIGRDDPVFNAEQVLAALACPERRSSFAAG